MASRTPRPWTEVSLQTMARRRTRPAPVLRGVPPAQWKNEVASKAEFEVMVGCLVDSVPEENRVWLKGEPDLADRASP